MESAVRTFQFISKPLAVIVLELVRVVWNLS